MDEYGAEDCRRDDDGQRDATGAQYVANYHTPIGNRHGPFPPV